MNIVVTGANGQLGTDIVLQLKGKGICVYAFGRKGMDITNQDQVNKLLTDIQPDIVIHTAAFTQVDLAEAAKDDAFLVNAVGTRNVAVAAEKIGAKLVYISTDYVFDGNSEEPIDEFQPTNPQTVYGKSKLIGEQFVRELHSRFFIVRTSWVFGLHGNNFVKTMLRLGKEQKELKVVNDQIGSPTYTVDLAEKIIELLQTEKYGIYHISNEGSCTWYEFAKKIFEYADMKEVKVIPCTTEEFLRPAIRPKYSVMDQKMLRLNEISPTQLWSDALRKFIKEVHI